MINQRQHGAHPQGGHGIEAQVRMASISSRIFMEPMAAGKQKPERLPHDGGQQNAQLAQDEMRSGHYKDLCPNCRRLRGALERQHDPNEKRL